MELRQLAIFFGYFIVAGEEARPIIRLFYLLFCNGSNIAVPCRELAVILSQGGGRAEGRGERTSKILSLLPIWTSLTWHGSLVLRFSQFLLMTCPPQKMLLTS